MKQSREAAEALSHGAFLCGASLRATFLRRLSFRARAAGANLAAVSAHGLESSALSAAANKCTSARQATQLAYQGGATATFRALWCALIRCVMSRLRR